MLCNVFLTFESVDEILNFDHPNESYRAVLSCGAVYYTVQGGANFKTVHEGRDSWTSKFKWHLPERGYPEDFYPKGPFRSDIRGLEPSTPTKTKGTKQNLAFCNEVSSSSA